MKRKDFVTIHAEMEALSSMLFILSYQLSEGENNLPDKALGAALHGIACYIERIDEDLDEIELVVGTEV